MSDSTEFMAGYLSPLTDKEHARLGRISVLWGQIEYYLDHLLPVVSGFSDAELKAIGLTEKNVGTKTQFLKAAIQRLTDPARAHEARRFCELIDNTKVARNHAFHGLWGWRASSRSKTVEPCARHSKHPAKPLKIADLAKLEKALCACSRVGHDLLNECLGWEKERQPVRFFHGADKAVPTWLSEWTGRNRVGREYLDQNAKEGQLPRLARHFPRT